MNLTKFLYCCVATRGETTCSSHRRDMDDLIGARPLNLQASRARRLVDLSPSHRKNASTAGYMQIAYRVARERAFVPEHVVSLPRCLSKLCGPALPFAHRHHSKICVPGCAGCRTAGEMTLHMTIKRVDRTNPLWRSP